MPRDYKSRPPKILIVEDDDDLAQCLTSSLEFEGYQVTVSNSGKKALQAVVNQHFDIISTDIKLPDWDGLTFLQYLRKSPQKDVPAVVVSGFLSHDYVKKLIDLEIRKIYTKPFKMDEFISSVNKLIGYEVASMKGKSNEQGNAKNGPLAFEDEFEVE